MDNNPFWEYSISVYSTDRIREILLQWQDVYGCDVNLALCCCWLAANARQLEPEQLVQLQQAAAPWRAQCLMPLRAARLFAGQQEGAEAVYQQLKSVELVAERWQQDRLYACVEDLGLEPAKGEGVAATNLRLYCALLSGVEWSDLAEDATELIALLAL